MDCLILKKNMFSKSTEYALRATIFIAQKSDENNKLGIDEISSSIGSPKHFTGKLLQILTKDNKVISSVRGPNGGFYMSAKAKKLPVKVILTAMGEDEILSKCILGLNECSEECPCPMHSEYKHIKKKLVALFQKKTIADLANDMNTQRLFIKNTNV